MQLTDFQPVPIPVSMRGLGAVQAYKSPLYKVTLIEGIFKNTAYSKLVVSAADNQKIPNHWRVLQDIKNLFWGEDAAAIEIYPPEKDLVDLANCYHLMAVDLDYLHLVVCPILVALPHETAE